MTGFAASAPFTSGDVCRAVVTGCRVRLVPWVGRGGSGGRSELFRKGWLEPVRLVLERDQFVPIHAFEGTSEALQACDGLGDDLGIARGVGGDELADGAAVLGDLERLTTRRAFEQFAETGFRVEGADTFHG